MGISDVVGFGALAATGGADMAMPLAGAMP